MPEPTNAPPAAPTTPAAPVQPPPAPPVEREPGDFMGDIEADLAGMDDGKPTAPRDEKGKFKKAEDKEKPAAKAPEKPEAKPEDEPVKPPEKPVEPEAGKTEKPVKAADLRTAYEGLKKKVQTEYEPQLQSLKAKVKELETRKPEESAPILAKLKTLEERNAELEKNIAYVDYTESDEFKQKYSEPYRQAWAEALSEFKELTVRERDGEDEAGEPKFKMRQADESDLLRLANLKLSEMDATATEMFGPSAARAINHIQNIRKLSNAQRTALDQAKNKSQEWRSQQSLESQQKAKAIGDLWNSTNKAMEEKFPKAFKVEADNPDDAAAHAKGFALADLMFLGNSALKPEQIEALPDSFKKTVQEGKPLSDQQKVQLHALSRLKMANHDRAMVKLKKLTERVAELEKSLEAYEKSEPATDGAGEGRKVTDKPWDQVIEDEIRAMDKA